MAKQTTYRVYRMAQANQAYSADDNEMDSLTDAIKQARRTMKAENLYAVAVRDEQEQTMYVDFRKSDRRSHAI